MKKINCVISVLLFAIVFESCTNNSQQETKVNNILDSTLSKKPIKNEIDSDFVLIVSKEGKLIKKITYIPDSRYYEHAYYIKGYPTSDTLIGDFNGDGIAENAWFYSCPDEEIREMKCNNGVINFSDNKIKPLMLEGVPFLTFKNEGDLNDDGKDEIGVLPGWYGSACRYYYVYTYKNNKWIECCEAIPNTENMREAGIVVIEKDKKNKGWAIIRQSIDSYDDKNNKIPAEYTRLSCCAFSNVVELRIKLK